MPSPGDHQEPESNRLLTGLCVLLVEDEWHIAAAMKSVLESAGLRVIGPAASVHAAETLLAAERPNVAMVDLNLRGSMAYELIDHLKALEVPVIVLSGYELLCGLKNKVEATLTKPVRASMLLGTLRQILTERSQP